ncbi:unnamed protein product, partial [Rotaria sp. Silwood1]
PPIGYPVMSGNSTIYINENLLQVDVYFAKFTSSPPTAQVVAIFALHALILSEISSHTPI